MERVSQWAACRTPAMASPSSSLPSVLPAHSIPRCHLPPAFLSSCLPKATFLAESSIATLSVMKQNPTPPPRERGSGCTYSERKQRQMLQRERQRQALRRCLPVQGVTRGCDNGITKTAALQPQPGVPALPEMLWTNIGMVIWK